MKVELEIKMVMIVFILLHRIFFLEREKGAETWWHRVKICSFGKADIYCSLIFFIYNSFPKNELIFVKGSYNNGQP